MPFVPRRRLLSGLHSLSPSLERKNVQKKLAENRANRVFNRWMAEGTGEPREIPRDELEKEQEKKDFLRLMKWRRAMRKKDAAHLLKLRVKVLRGVVKKAQAEEELKGIKERRGKYFTGRDEERKEKAEIIRREKERDRYDRERERERRAKS